MNCRNNIAICLIAACIINLTGCASVPKEVVQLSEAVGSDIDQLYAGYRQSVRASFVSMRLRGLKIIDETWTPTYLETFVKDPIFNKAVAAAQDTDNPDTKGIEIWARKAIRDIDNKRQEFLSPLQVKEDALLADIDEAFSRAARMNATVTGYLGSIKKVKLFQDKIVSDLGLKETREKLRAGLEEASAEAAKHAKEVASKTD